MGFHCRSMGVTSRTSFIFALLRSFYHEGTKGQSKGTK
jgi:hypothetical protein